MGKGGIGADPSAHTGLGENVTGFAPGSNLAVLVTVAAALILIPDRQGNQQLAVQPAPITCYASTSSADIW